MSGIPIGVAALDGVVLTALTRLNNGEVDDAVTRFAEEFRFKDYGIGFLRRTLTKGSSLAGRLHCAD